MSDKISTPLVTELDETQREFVTKQHYYKPDDQLDEDVTQLMEWLSKQQHLPDITDRKWLSHFIIGCKYSLYRAKNTIESYFINRAENPEFICRFEREPFLEVMKTGTVILLPKSTPEGYRVLCSISMPTKGDEKLDFLVYFQSVLATLDIQLKDVPMLGEILLFDLNHLQLSQFLSLSPTMTKNFVSLCINSFPLSLKSIHFINPPFFIGQVIVLIKMFLKNKLKKRICVHNTLDTLYQFIPKDILPEQYGGGAGDMSTLKYEWFEYCMSENEWLGNRPKADLSKRTSPLKTNDFGIDGTFKQMQID